MAFFIYLPERQALSVKAPRFTQSRERLSTAKPPEG
jgi:hypothetical protein